MAKLLTWNTIAKLMILKDRASSYLSVFNYLISILTYLQVFGWSMQSIIISVIGLIVVGGITIVDWYKIFPEVNRVNFEKNPEWMEKTKEFQDVKKKVSKRRGV